MFQKGDLVVTKPWSQDCGYAKKDAGRVGLIAAQRAEGKRVKVRFGGQGPDGVTYYVQADSLEIFHR